MLHYVERGQGTPFLALHGWTPDHRLMLGCLEPVFSSVPGYRRLYPDLPAMGQSPAPASIASSDHILNAVQEFVEEHIGSEPFLLAGESYGGYLARALANARPSQVLGLALICPVGTALEQADRRLPEHVVLRRDPSLPDGHEDFTSITVVQTAETLRRFQEDVLPGLEAADTQAMARIRLNWKLASGPETGEPFTGPSLILTGRQDSVTGYLDQFDLLPHYPRATFAVLDMAGHNLQIEQPELFSALVTDWLTRAARRE